MKMAEATTTDFVVLATAVSLEREQINSRSDLNVVSIYIYPPLSLSLCLCILESYRLYIYIYSSFHRKNTFSCVGNICCEFPNNMSVFVSLSCLKRFRAKAIGISLGP